MSDGPGRGIGPRRPRLRRAAALATMACLTLLGTACGGGSSPAAGSPTREQAALAYARCMRAHGVPDFPDPDSNGSFSFSASERAGGLGGSGSSSVSGQVTRANQVCNHLLDVGTQLNAAQQQHAFSQLLKYAQCMRAHGVPNFPDPHTTSGGIGTPSGIAFDMSGIDTQSTQYRAANQACQSLAKNAKG
jgi:hypothetical protein